MPKRYGFTKGMASVLDAMTPMLQLSYPIRDDVLAEIVVPRQMTTNEAKRLCAFIMTLTKADE